MVDSNSCIQITMLAHNSLGACPTRHIAFKIYSATSHEWLLHFQYWSTSRGFAPMWLSSCLAVLFRQVMTIVDEAELFGASHLYTPISLYKKKGVIMSLQDLTPAGCL